VANLQLAELEAYDRHLDLVLERSYRDLAGAPMRTRKALITGLRELRIDMARFSDELSNINKFLGDWHLARIYETTAGRFHLADWKKGVEEKLKTVGELHELLKSDHANRWMMALEITIVLLFILDVVLLILGGKK
jgi:poly-beta-hydroxyalkanoate depolymerase